MLETRRQVTGKVSIVGHRGAPDSAPENTLASFREGYRQGADIIELDVQLSADGSVVVFHDDLLDRTTDGHGPLAERALVELKRLDAGSWRDARFAGEAIPTLDEVLAWAKNVIPLFVELKYGPYSNPGLDAAVVERIVAYGMVDQVMVISFNHHALRQVKERVADLATGALYSQLVDDPVGLAQEVRANAIMPLWHVVTPKDVNACHEAGLSVNVWGRDADYWALITAGVDCVSADHPARVVGEFFEERNG